MSNENGRLSESERQAAWALRFSSVNMPVELDLAPGSVKPRLFPGAQRIDSGSAAGGSRWLFALERLPDFLKFAAAFLAHLGELQIEAFEHRTDGRRNRQA
jgi:hypothetical protein